MYKRSKEMRVFWIQRGLAYLFDGLVALVTLGWYDSDMSLKVADKTLYNSLRKKGK